MDVIIEGDNQDEVLEGESLQESLDRVDLDGFHPLAVGLTVIYAVFTGNSLTGMVVPGYAFNRVVLMDCAMLTVAASLWYLLGKRLVPLRFAPLVGMGLATILLVKILMTLSVLGVPEHTVYVVVLIIGSGSFVLAIRGFLAIVTMSVVGWAAVVWQHAVGPELAYHGLSIFTAVVLAAIVRRARYNAFVRVYELRRADAAGKELLARALEDSEGRYRQIVETAFEGVGITDADGALSYANPRVSEMLGRSADELLGLPLLEIVHPDDRADMGQRSASRAIAGNEQYECRFLHRDGSFVWCLVSASPLVDAEGGFVGALGLLTDVTERKLVESSRERYARRLEALQEVDRAILAAELPITTAQAALSRVVDLVPCDWACVLLRESAGEDVTVLRTGESGFEEHRLPGFDFSSCHSCWGCEGVRVDDTEAWSNECTIAGVFGPVEVRSLICEPLSFGGEQLGGLLLVSKTPSVFDSEHEEIARELAGMLALSLHQTLLRRSAEDGQEMLRAVVEHLPEAVLVLDQERRIVFANPVAESNLPSLGEAAIGDALDTVGGLELADLLEAGEVDGRQSLEVGGDSPLHFEIAARRLTSDNGPRGFVVVLRDVTQEKAVQNQIQAQQRIAAVGQLASGIAHDFNNILQTILMYGDLLGQNSEISDDDLESVDAIIHQATRASTLVRQILDFSRRSVWSGRPLDISRQIADTVDLLRRTIREQVRLVLEVEEDARGYVVRADQAQLQQVITNLVVNAQDAMPMGGEVRVSLGHLELTQDQPRIFPGMDPGHWVEIGVSDTGAGIPEELQSRVYEPFFTTKEPGKGTGLGLAQVYGIVKQHEGYIDLSSAEGRGTTFKVYLPWISDEDGDLEEDADPTLRRGHGEQIVVVEDEAPLLGIISRALESFGYVVRPMQDAAEAIELCERLGDSVDLVLSDVVMPKHSGPDLLLRIKPSCTRALFVLMSGYPLDEHLDVVSSSLDFQWLQKPFSARHLLEVVTSALDSRDTSRE